MNTSELGTLSTDELQALAQERVDGNEELSAIEPAIFYEWSNWKEHLIWIITAPVAEIVLWEDTVEPDEEPNEE